MTSSLEVVAVPLAAVYTAVVAGDRDTVVIAIAVAGTVPVVVAVVDTLVAGCRICYRCCSGSGLVVALVGLVVAVA